MTIVVLPNIAVNVITSGEEPNRQSEPMRNIGESKRKLKKQKDIVAPLQGIAVSHNVSVKFIEDIITKMCGKNICHSDIRDELGKKGIKISLASIGNFLRHRRKDFKEEISLKLTLGEAVSLLRSYFFKYSEICKMLNDLGIRTLKFKPITENLICKYFLEKEDGTNFKNDFIFKSTLRQLQVKNKAK
jgi:hypothetical protein